MWLLLGILNYVPFLWKNHLLEERINQDSLEIQAIVAQ